MSIGAGPEGWGNDPGVVAPDVDPGSLADYELVADMREFQGMQAQMYVRTPGGVTRATRPPGWYADPEP